MNQPLIAAALGDAAARAAVGAEPWELCCVDTVGELVTAQLPAVPRLFVIQADSAPAESLPELLRTLRRERPLTDVCFWAPQAGRGTVRELFRAGAKDVVASRSPVKLVASIREVLGEQQLLARVSDLTGRRSRGGRFESLLSRSAAMWDLFELCAQIAPTDATVLIVGETGTGKELLARALHRLSRRTGRFVPANCASIPRDLIRSELFGHEKGAFTGADRAKKGLAMHADSGTLFLDEIGDMPAETQLSLLRLLQERQIRPVGSLVESPVDVRIIAATHAALDDRLRSGQFREDLFYRLDVIRINVPALRERPEDIVYLFGCFTKRLAKHYGLDPPTFAESFLDALVAYQWPGNVRQLENFTERLVLSRPRRALTSRDFQRLRSTSLARTGPSAGGPSDGAHVRARVDTSRSLQQNLDPVLAQLEQEYLQNVLRDNGGRVAAAARQAGISRRTLLRKMRLYDIEKNAFRPQ